MIVEAILLTVITAATPLVIAALGELVTERAGVLNLGVEGMMIIGAVCAFAAAQMTGSPYIGILAGIAGGAVFSLLFGFLTLTLVANQVATGLALTILGLGLSGQMGESFVGVPGIKLQPIVIPVLADLPFVGKLLFRQDLIFYLSIALVIGINWFLFRSRTGLTLRAIGTITALPTRWASMSSAPATCRAVRRRLRWTGRGATFAGLYPAMGGKHVGWTRLDRAGAGGFCLLAAVACAGRRLPVWRRDDRSIACPGVWHRFTLAISVSVALRCHYCRARHHFA